MSTTSDRAPRGNGTNVHLKTGETVFVQENERETRAAWHKSIHQQGYNVVTLTGATGPVSVHPDNISYIEER